MPAPHGAAEAPARPSPSRPAPVPVPARGPDAPAPVSGAAPPQPASDTGVPSTAYGEAAGNGLLAAIGSGLRLSAADLATRDLDLRDRPQPLPGVVLRSLRYRNGKVTLTGDLRVPYVAEGELTITVAGNGAATIAGGAERALEIPALGNPKFQIALDDAGALSGAVSAKKLDPAPQGIEAEASGELAVAGDRMTGSGEAKLSYPGVGSAEAWFGFDEDGTFTARGKAQLTAPFLDRIDADLAVDPDLNLTAHADLDVAAQRSPVPGLILKAGKATVDYLNGRPSASVTDFTADYSGFATVNIAQLGLDRRRTFTGAGSLELIVPVLEPVRGQVSVGRSGVSGSLKITSEAFPEALPVTGDSVTGTLARDGRVSFGGTVAVDLGPAGRGNLSAGYDRGAFSLGAEVDLTVPGLRPVHVSVAYADGELGAAADVPVDPEVLPGLDGAVTVRLEDGLWSGQSTLNYSADDGKLSGTLTVTVAQTPEDTLEATGSGAVTAQLMPGLSGTLTASVLPEGGVDVSGAIEVTEPLELFPEKRMDRELFSHAQSIPLWAIVVAVVRARAGVRAGVGPGVFRNIRVEGSYTVGSTDADPSFSVSGEVYIPAFVEGYVAFGAGLGMDVVLGSLTGGIEGVGTAGLYGAVSVVPELHYADGDWGFEGTATLAAGARLTLGLNAWAEVEAAWVTVWENEWELAKHVMPVGTDLALRTHLNYTFGQPEPPEIEFSSSDIDAEALIQGAMPEDGPAPSGAREALENRAEWQGALREQREAPLPPDLTAQAEQAETPPKAPPKPPENKPGPPAGGVPAEGAGPNQDPGAAPAPGNELARSQAIDEAAAPDTTIPPPVPASEVLTADAPRHPGPITLATLDEPPVPLPRTQDQAKADLDAARRAVELASAEASDSDALDNYFPRIKKRFGLVSLGYEGDFARGFELVGKVNPEFHVKAVETLTRTGLPHELQTGHITKMTFWTATLATHDVGIRMVAHPLGPDHPKGSEPAGQKSLMALLTEDYIRGHLLNHNIGGPGEAKNMFPITRSANAVHHNEIEKPLKEWINEDRYWVTYEVEIKARDEIEGPGTPRLGYINSTIHAKASVLNTQLDPVTTIETSIESLYKTKATTSGTIDVAEAEKHIPEGLARDVDHAYEIQLPDGRDTLVTFPAAWKTFLDQEIPAHQDYGEGKGEGWVRDQLKECAGIGPKRAEILLRAYGAIQEPDAAPPYVVAGLDASDKGQFTQIDKIIGPDLGAKLAGPTCQHATG